MQMKQKEPQICVESQYDCHVIKAVDVTYEEHFRLQVRVPFSFVDHVRCRVRQCEVEQPVGGGCHGQGFGPHFQWEQLSGDNPCDRTPRACEEEDVETYESDGNFLRRLVIGTRDCSGDGHDVLADTHADSTHEKEVAAAHLFDEIEAWECGYYVHTAVDGQLCACKSL